MLIVHPGPARDVSVAEAYADPLGGRLTSRPWVALCMVSSLDGSTVVDGTSGALSSPNDGEVLLQLRSLAEVVLVGAGTAAGEGYGPPKRAGQRIGVVTRSGSVDVDSELFRSGAGFVVTTTGSPVDDDRCEVLRCGEDTVDLTVALTRLDEIVPDVTVVQAEGGPMLNGALAAADLVDELDLTLSPSVVGGEGPRLTRGADRTGNGFEPAQIAVDDHGFVFTRWRRLRI